MTQPQSQPTKFSDDAIERVEAALDAKAPAVRRGDLEVVTNEIHQLRRRCATLARQFGSALFHAEHLALEARHLVESAQSLGVSSGRRTVPSQALLALEQAIRAEEEDIHHHAQTRGLPGHPNEPGAMR